MSGCCYANPADERAFVKGRCCGGGGLLVPLPNLSTRTGRRVLTIPIVAVLGLVGLGWNLSRMLGGGEGEEDEWGAVSEDYCSELARCSDMFCSADYDYGCQGPGRYTGFQSIPDCQSYWAAETGAAANAVLCQLTTCLSFFGSDYSCQLDERSMTGNMTNLAYYACVRDSNDWSSLPCN